MTTTQVPLIPQVPSQVLTTRKPKTRNEWTARLGGSEFKILRMQDAPTSQVQGDTPEVIEAYLRAQLPKTAAFNPDVESLMVVCLSSRRKIIGFSVVSMGTLDTLLCHAREIFKNAIVMNASAIVIAHNHPSGDPTPSEADIKVTRDLIRAGQVLKIDVLDHVILGTPQEHATSGFCSLRALGYFYS